jgi:hypothetical protein
VAAFVSDNPGRIDNVLVLSVALSAPSGRPRPGGVLGRRFPSRDFAVNTAWLSAVAIAADLTAWLRLLALSGPLANAEPKALRYRLLHVPARLTRSARRRHLRLPATWPWVDDLVAVFTRIAAIPQPA